jgi:hydrogenase expression/formation protein HypE
LAVVGATPRFMTLSVFVEEGLDIAVLRRVVDSLANAARLSGVSVVAGDTKVVGRGECDGIYLSTTGIGFKPSDHRFALDRIKVGDQILVSGPLGEHGAAVMLARQEFGFRGDLRSDASSVLNEARALIGPGGLRFMREIRRAAAWPPLHKRLRMLPALRSNWSRPKFLSMMPFTRSASYWGSILFTWRAREGLSR